jgi:hypothetical protein
MSTELTRRELNLLYRAYRAAMPIPEQFDRDLVLSTQRKINPCLTPSNGGAPVSIDTTPDERRLLAAVWAVGAEDAAWATDAEWHTLRTKLAA